MSPACIALTASSMPAAAGCASASSAAAPERASRARWLRTNGTMRDSRKRRTLMADAGWILPLYHGNAAETDLKPVDDVDWISVFGQFACPRQICIRANPADATKYDLTV